MMSALQRVTWGLMPPTALFSLISLILYFAYRLECLLRAQRLIASGPATSVADGTTSLAMAWLFFAIELLTICRLLPCLRQNMC